MVRRRGLSLAGIHGLFSDEIMRGPRPAGSELGNLEFACPFGGSAANYGLVATREG